MPKYRITQTSPALAKWVYEVEADSPEHAEQRVTNEFIDPASYEVEGADIEPPNTESVELIED
jgi:hypothetical protein